MKQLFMMLFMALALTVSAQKVEKKADGNYYAVLDTAKVSANSFYVDNKGKTWPLYITKTGKLYYIKNSAKTGKEYKAYLKQ